MLQLRPILSLSALLLILPRPAQAESSSWVKVLADEPGRLEIELRPPAPDLKSRPGGPVRPICGGCQGALVEGAPDLPWYRFEILSGPAEPKVAVHILETEIHSLAGGLASVPRQLSPTRHEERPDPALYAAARSLATRISGIRPLRGAPVRGVEVPLALWTEDTRTLTMLRRLKVVVEFPDARARPTAVRLPASFLAEVMNPKGGAWLYDQQRSRPLRRRAAANPPSDPGSRFIRISIGDKAVDNLGEDQVYALGFEEAAEASPAILGARIENLRLFTGANDTLHRGMGPMPDRNNRMDMPGILREIPLDVVDGNGNETFDKGDTLKFFAHGSSVWRRIPGNRGPIRYEFSVDPYSFQNHYFLGFQAPRRPADKALRLPTVPSLPATSTVREASPYYVRAEQDRETASCDPSNHKDEESGFAWFWHWKGTCDTHLDSAVLGKAALAGSETANLVDIAPGPAGDSVYVGFYTYSSKNENNFRAYMKGDTLAYVTGHQSHAPWYLMVGKMDGGSAFALDQVIWWEREKRFEGYSVRYVRSHKFRGSPLWIFPEAAGVRATYKVVGGQGATALRIVDGVAEAALALDGDGMFTDSLPVNADARYLIHNAAARLPAGSLVEESEPAEGGALRDLITGEERKVEYLIVTARPLLDAALALREYRRGGAVEAGIAKRSWRLERTLATEVVLVEDVFRQFGSGRMSPPALRNFLRWAYHNWARDEEGGSPLKYVLFFGDGHYDYRGIHSARRTGPPVPNHIPPYEFIIEGGSEEIASEDFYAWLDEGDNHLDTAQMDVAIGRLPVQSLDHAKVYLEKVKAWEAPFLGGDWRSRVVLAADDHLQRGSKYGDLDPIPEGHTTDSEKLGQAMAGDEPALNLDRVYLLDYAMNSSYRKPEAAQDILSFLNRGALVVNYVGHGSSNQWADEVLLQTSDALSRLQNRERTGMVNAFSCTVGRFESLASEGMSEQFVKQPHVGAIGAVSATRESFPRPNIALATAFYSRVFDRDSATGRSPTVGEALMRAKNSPETGGNNLNDMKYALLGEPVISLRRPALDLAFTARPDTLRALDCSTISGTVAGGSGSGFVNLKITAGAVHKDYILPQTPQKMWPQYADKRGAILFERTFPYKAGKFSTEYFLPRQVAFGDSTARITTFAWDTERDREGSLAVQNLRIQGTAATCPADTSGQGPRIRVTGCEGGETGGVDFPDRVKLPIPYCLQIQVEDSAGGVLSAEGPDEGTTVEVPGVLDPFHPLPGIDDLYQKTYQMTLEARDFRPGSYVLKVSARDGYGNLGQRQMRMDLTQDSSITTLRAYNVPNPVKRSGTTFYFTPTLPRPEVELGGTTVADKRLLFEVRIFDQGGKVVNILRDAENGITRWDGHDQWGNRLGNGVYFYTVTARWNQQPGTVASYRTVSTKRNTLVLSR